LRKKNKFIWEHKQDLAMEELKKILKSPPILKQVDYESGRPVIMTVDTSPIAIGWVVEQDDAEGRRHYKRKGCFK